MKNTVLKFLTIGISLFVIGYGFKICSPLFPERPVLASFEQNAHQRIVYAFADSCLRYAKSVEASDKQYSPQEYFQSVRLIDSMCKHYDVQNPSHIIKDLRNILTDGTGCIPMGMRDAFNKAHESNSKPLGFTFETLKTILRGIIVLLTICGLVLLMKFTPKIVQVISKIINGISFKIIRENTVVVINCIVIKLWCEYLSRPPNGYYSKIEKVPWIFI